jgi:RNA polymerase sigma factor (TIGR02999 family)
MAPPADDAPGADGTVTVTRLLRAAGAGDPAAAAELLPLVYQQLRRLAKSHMRQERPGQTLQATALVHEAYLRVVDQTGVPEWEGRWHFFAAAAEAMRRILVDNARRRGSAKRGGVLKRVSLDENELTVDEPPEGLVLLDEALSELARKYPAKAELVKLRYFAGLTIEESSEALGIGTSTAARHWAFARAWLYRRMSASPGVQRRD